MSEKLTTLKQLREAAVSSKNLIADVATAAAEAIEEVDEAKADKASFATATLATAGWAKNTDTASAAAGYAYRYALPVNAATAADGAECIIAPGDLSAASACGMCQTVDVIAGYIHFYAATTPASDISIQVRLVSGATTKGG